MTMPGNPGAQVGAASFGIGIDLTSFQRDLDAAEALARSRAVRIQGILGQIPISGTGPLVAVGPRQTARATTAARVAQQAGGSIPPWVQAVYQAAIANGATPDQAIAALRAQGAPREVLAALQASARAGSGGGTAPSSPAATPPRQARPPRPTAPQQSRTPGAAGGSRGSGNGGIGGFLGDLLPSSPQGIARVALGIAGISAGFNVAATAARLLSQGVVGAIDATIELEQRAREVGVAFGNAGEQFRGPGAVAFGADSLTAGTTAQYEGLVASLAPLASQFNLTNAQIQQVSTASGQLARLWGVDLQQAGNSLQQVLRGNLQAGQQLDLQLVDQYGVVKGLGLTYEELVQAVGPAEAAQKLLAVTQADVDRQLTNNAKNADATAQAFDALGKHADDLRNQLADLAKTPIQIAITFAAGATGPKPGQAIEDWIRERIAAVTTPPSPTAPQTKAQQALTTFRLPPEATAGLPALPPPVLPSSEQGVTAAINSQFARDQAARAATDRAALDQARDAAQKQRDQAGIQASGAQAQLDRLSAESQLRTLSVQDRANQLALSRINLEQQLAPLLLQQQQLQDAIGQGLRERLDLTQQLLQAQQAAEAPTRVAQELSYEQQRVRLEAQVQQASAIRGQGPVAGLPSVPDLMRQARDLALSAPAVNLQALDAQQTVTRAQAAQQSAQTAQQLQVLPLEQQLQDVTAALIPTQEELGRVNATAQALSAALDIANIMTSPAVVKAEQDLAAARISQADAAVRIAQAQAQVGGFNLNASASVNVEGVTDVDAMVNAVIDAFKPQLVSAVNAALLNPRRPGTVRGGPP